MSAPTPRELRDFAQSLGLPVGDKGRLPAGVYDRWDREHPDRPSVRPRPSGAFAGLWFEYGRRGA